ncbi:MAG: hypothetical protein JW993_04705 [Sedimentisphaerales bacterium]|nr:hypothetical protein [Sedimentisphaerales bacterium]
MARQAQDKQALARKFRSRKWPWVLLGILVVILLAVLLTPVYLSSDSFKQMLQAKVGRSTGGRLSIGNLSVGWLKGVRVSDLSFHEKAGWASVNVKGIDAQPRLGALLGGTLSLGRTVIEQPQIEIDLRKRPSAAATEAPTQSPAPAAGLALLSDMTIRNGSVSLTSRQGQTVRVGNVDSELKLRPPGQTSSVQADMVVGNAHQEAQIHAAGTIKPSGWTLKGTTGDVTVEVNDLNLDSLAPFFELAGVDLQTRGRVTANIKGALQDGNVQNLTADIQGQGLDISGAPLKGDRLQTSQLDVTARLTQQAQAVQIERLDAKTDWATVTASGTIPKTAQSLGDLLKSDANYRLQGDFQCALAPLLSQMPNTFGLKPGMKITAGKATGTINTTTLGGRASIVADTEIAGLAGQVDGKTLKLSQPVAASLKLSADGQKTRVDNLDVSAAFASVTASGDFEQIKYEGTADLAKFQAELGQFANLGAYEMAGNLASTGQVSIGDERIAATGTAAVKQLVLTSADGNSVSEPAANIEFALGLDQAKHMLSIDSAKATGSFGDVTVTQATVPLGGAPSAALRADVVLHNLDLARAKPFAVFFASFPQEMELEGIAESELALQGQDEGYRVRTENARIQNLRLATPGKEPFAQKQVTLSCDVQIDPNEKAINVESLLVESAQIRITKGQFKKVSQGDKNQIQGSLEGQADWAAVGQVASAFLPEGLQMTGRRQVSVNFASTYPADDPNALMANLNGTASTGFDSASYMGLNVGATDLKVRIENGLMQVEPFTTTVNDGKLSFAAQANLREQTPLLRTPKPLMLAQGVQINQEMTGKLLQYVNPLFANVTGVSGVANFECQRLAIPLAGGMKNKTEVVGTFSANDIVVEASGLLAQILTAMGEPTTADKLTIQPTSIVLQNGVVHYDNMEVRIGENPVTFSGSIGLDERLNMTVTLPWTMAGRTVRIGQPQQGQRIPIPLKGTLSRPELDVERLLQDQLLRGLDRLFNR